MELKQEVNSMTGSHIGCVICKELRYKLPGTIIVWNY